MVKFKMSDLENTEQKKSKQLSPNHRKRRKAKDYNSLAGALRQNLRRRKEAGVLSNNLCSTSALVKKDQL